MKQDIIQGFLEQSGICLARLNSILVELDDESDDNEANCQEFGETLFDLVLTHAKYSFLCGLKNENAELKMNDEKWKGF